MALKQLLDSVMPFFYDILCACFTFCYNVPFVPTSACWKQRRDKCHSFHITSHLRLPLMYVFPKCVMSSSVRSWVEIDSTLTSDAFYSFYLNQHVVIIPNAARSSLAWSNVRSPIIPRDSLFHFIRFLPFLLFVFHLLPPPILLFPFTSKAPFDKRWRVGIIKCYYCWIALLIDFWSWRRSGKSHSPALSALFNWSLQQPLDVGWTLVLWNKPELRLDRTKGLIGMCVYSMCLSTIEETKSAR